MRSLVQFYALAVCFCTLMCLVIALGIGIYDVVQLAAPEFTLPSQWQQSDEQYLALYHPEKKNVPAAEVDALREESHQTAIEIQRRSAQQSLVLVGIICAIDIVVYAIHWRIARRAEPRAV